MRFDHRTRLTLGGQSRVGNWSTPSPIRSIQRGTISITGATSNTATITAVVVANSRLKYLGRTNNDPGQAANQALVQLVFTNATTITASVNTSPAATITAVNFEVIEYWPGAFKSIQRGQTSAAALTATITAVNPAKSEVDYLGCTASEATTIFTRDAKVTLTNATTVGISYGAASDQTVSWQVVEWF